MMTYKTRFNVFQIARAITIAFFSLLFIGTTYAQESVTTINPPQPVENDGKIEVLEFFAYGCIHCANLEIPFAEWARKQSADVKIKRIPSPAPIRGIDSVPLFYSLEAMGQLDRLHAKIFNAANLENVILGNPATLNKWLEKNGVDIKKYDDVQKSFSVAAKISRAGKTISDYQISVTPTIVVNGRHKITQGTDSTSVFFAKVDQLIAEARASMKASPAIAQPKRSGNAKAVTEK